MVSSFGSILTFFFPSSTLPLKATKEVASLLTTRAVPKPRPGVFRITKNIHNILQGVSHPGQWVTPEDKQTIIDWIEDNANRYWFREGGPLQPPEDGGAHVIVVSPDCSPVMAFLRRD